MSAYVHAYSGTRNTNDLSGREPFTRNSPPSDDFASLLEDTDAAADQSSDAGQSLGTNSVSASASSGREPWLMSADDLALLGGDSSSVPGAITATGAEPASTQPASAISDSPSWAGTEPAAATLPNATPGTETVVVDADLTPAQGAINAMRESAMRFDSLMALLKLGEDFGG